MLPLHQQTVGKGNGAGEGGKRKRSEPIKRSCGAGGGSAVWRMGQTEKEPSQVWKKNPKDVWRVTRGDAVILFADELMNSS